MFLLKCSAVFEQQLVLNLVSVWANRVVVPEQVTAVLGKNVTLTCRVEVSTNLSLTQSSWERRLPSGTATLAVFNPQYGTSISDEYSKRVHFIKPSVHDVSIVLQGVGFADIGTYTCKVVTFQLGNMQASTTVDIMVEPKVYVSPGSLSLLDGDGETLVATCTAERGRDHILPSCNNDLNYVTVAPDVTVIGQQDVWYVGQKNLQLDCRASANPPALMYLWTRLDAPMPAGVDTSNGSLLFTRPLEPSDSGQYRCEVQNDVGQSFKDVRFLIQEPPPATASPTSTSSKSILPDTSLTITAPINQHAHFTGPTQASPPDSGLGTIVGGAVGGILILVLLMVLVGAFYMRQRRTFRGDYYTKQYIGPSDMQKESQMDVLQPHELQDVYGDDSGNGSQDLKPKPEGDIIYPDYPIDHKDMEGWEDNLSLQRESTYYSDHHNHHNVNPSGPPLHNGSPYLQDKCYDHGTDSDYISHVDGSVISRREWYV
uniref:Nectin-3-like protein n=1 Tax=Sinocyclocheilus anshuiensis TaxID=1608454 RepID=A0A671SM27_9TELE